MSFCNISQYVIRSDQGSKAGLDSTSSPKNVENQAFKSEDHSSRFFEILKLIPLGTPYVRTYTIYRNHLHLFIADFAINDEWRYRLFKIWCGWRISFQWTVKCSMSIYLKGRKKYCWKNSFNIHQQKIFRNKINWNRDSCSKPKKVQVKCIRNSDWLVADIYWNFIDELLFSAMLKLNLNCK